MNITKIAGIIAEYNPLHYGHVYQITQTKAHLGHDTAIICAMSGNFVQRGDFAIVRKHIRAAAAVQSGADLVLELPLPWATASAERFAEGGVQVLNQAGVVTHLSFGSECGNAEALNRVATCLRSAEFPAVLKRELSSGISFATARHRAVEQLCSPSDAKLLASPNNVLGIEYCKALQKYQSNIVPLSILRTGASHDGEPSDGFASGSWLRQQLLHRYRDGTEIPDELFSYLPPAMQQGYCREEGEKKAPVDSNICERAILAHLRMMEEDDFQRFDEGNEGLYHRFYKVSRTATTIAELLDGVRTKRYAYARLRRMLLWTYLNLPVQNRPETVPYLRVLAANRRGCDLLVQMKQMASVPILTKSADVRNISSDACELFALEVRATDLYTLGYPNQNVAVGGMEWREGPVIFPV